MPEGYSPGALKDDTSEPYPKAAAAQAKAANTPAKYAAFFTVFPSSAYR